MVAKSNCSVITIVNCNVNNFDNQTVLRPFPNKDLDIFILHGVCLFYLVHNSQVVMYCVKHLAKILFSFLRIKHIF